MNTSPRITHLTFPHSSIRQSRQALLEFLQFLLLSGCAYAIREINLFSACPQQFKVILGCPPPALLTNIALTIYGIANVIPQCISLAGGSRPVRTHRHLAYLVCFYLFYLVSNALAANFIGVLTVGLVIYGLGQMSIWADASRAVDGDYPAF